MKAKTLGSILRVLALVALAAVLAPRVASAQDETGKFTLPTEVHWGAATLPAGDYSFSVESSTPLPRLYVYRESNPSGGYMFIARAQDIVPAISEQDHLVLEQEDGEAFVTALQLESKGLVLHFAPSKSLR